MRVNNSTPTTNYWPLIILVTIVAVAFILNLQTIFFCSAPILLLYLTATLLNALIASRRRQQQDESSQDRHTNLP